MPNSWSRTRSIENLSYEPPGNELLSREQDKKAWQTFIETYETPVNKVQDWYNSIVDKDSADAAAKSFNTDVLPILKKLTGPTADMKKQVLSIPASSEMQKFILLRILQLQSRLLVISYLCRVKGKWTTTPVTEAVIFFSILFWNLQLNQPRTLPNSLIPGMNPKSI